MNRRDCVVEIDVSKEDNDLGEGSRELFSNSTTNIRHHIREQMVFASRNFGGQNLHAQQSEEDGYGPDDRFIHLAAPTLALV